MKQLEDSESHGESTISLASFSFDERETFQWLCKRKGKDPHDFKVEGREHTPDPESTRIHRDVVVRYLPTGKARRYCPDYGESWVVKFGNDLWAHYFTPQDRTVFPRYLILN